MTNCPKCDVSPGKLHKRGCDVERCAYCGGQEWSCCCDKEELKYQRLRWSGEWPGLSECREFNWYCRRAPSPQPGYIACDKNDPDAHEDLNRLFTDAQWDRKAGRYFEKQSLSTVIERTFGLPAFGVDGKLTIAKDISKRFE